MTRLLVLCGLGLCGAVAVLARARRSADLQAHEPAARLDGHRRLVRANDDTDWLSYRDPYPDRLDARASHWRTLARGR